MGFAARKRSSQLCLAAVLCLACEAPREADARLLIAQARKPLAELAAGA